MNYDEIEELVTASKASNMEAKETLAIKFRPFILKLSKKTHITSYEFSDIVNECYKTLFKSIIYYNTDSHRFVAYATNAIKNTVISLIRSSIKKSESSTYKKLIVFDKVDGIICPDTQSLEDIVIKRIYVQNLKVALKSLKLEDQELLYYMYFKKYSLKRLSKIKGFSYTSAVNKKIEILNKLKTSIETVVYTSD